MDGRVTRWAGQRERRRREFVDAALRAIAEQGPNVTTEQIAQAAGVTRPQVYKHFAGAADLQGAIAERAVAQLLTELAPLWQLRGTPRQMISEAVGSHLTWLSTHRHLYTYLDALSGRRATTDLKTAIGTHLTSLFEYYLDVFGVDSRAAGPLAFGIVGLIESSTVRWLDDDRGIRQARFTALLSGWVWALLDSTLRGLGIAIDPDAPLVVPDLAFPRRDLSGRGAGH